MNPGTMSWSSTMDLPRVWMARTALGSASVFLQRHRASADGPTDGTPATWRCHAFRRCRRPRARSSGWSTERHWRNLRLRPLLADVPTLRGCTACPDAPLLLNRVVPTRAWMNRSSLPALAHRSCRTHACVDVPWAKFEITDRRAGHPVTDRAARMDRCESCRCVDRRLDP